jgi:hypothetical protein
MIENFLALFSRQLTRNTVSPQPGRSQMYLKPSTNLLYGAAFGAVVALVVGSIRAAEAIPDAEPTPPMTPSTKPERMPDYQALAHVLHAIRTCPNVRDRPITGDVVGQFDFWFDGGAGRIQTGMSEYEFTDGTRVSFHLGGPPLSHCFQVYFANGWTVQLRHN